jgi:prolyl-tRNA synthetase
MKGVPVRIEIGPKDIENNQCIAAMRFSGEKRAVSLENDLETFAGTIVNMLEKEIPEGMFAKAAENRAKHTYTCTSIDEIKEALEKNGDGFVKAMWCGEEECEDKVKELTGVGSRCMPLKQETISDKCVCCGKPAKALVYWGKAY